MQFSTLIATLFAASGALAAPARASSNDDVVVSLIYKLQDGVQRTLSIALPEPKVHKPVAAFVKHGGPFLNGAKFDQVQITLGNGVQNKALRCSVELNGHQLWAFRGANKDVTFGDGGNGPWTFFNNIHTLTPVPTKADKIVCSQEFVKGTIAARDAPADDVYVEEYDSDESS